jgi:hypothetical protein
MQESVIVVRKQRQPRRRQLDVAFATAIHGDAAMFVKLVTKK